MVTVTSWLDQSNITPRPKKGQHSEHGREPIMKGMFIDSSAAEPKRTAVDLSSVASVVSDTNRTNRNVNQMQTHMAQIVCRSLEESSALASRRYLMSIHQADRKLRQLLHGPSAEYLERLVLQCSCQAEHSEAVQLVQDQLDLVQAIIDSAEDARSGLLKLLGPYSADFQTTDSIVHEIRQFVRELVNIGGYCMSGIEELGDAYEQSSLWKGDNRRYDLKIPAGHVDKLVLLAKAELKHIIMLVGFHFVQHWELPGREDFWWGTGKPSDSSFQSVLPFQWAVSRNVLHTPVSYISGTESWDGQDLVNMTEPHGSTNLEVFEVYQMNISVPNLGGRLNAHV
ncbi:hypothetical protein C8J56DRAFT_888872 [Mycena floridula]|nr:hypothetical protein C8J56DRAFT_888872 [Mycena floridula]